MPKAKLAMVKTQPPVEAQTLPLPTGQRVAPTYATLEEEVAHLRQRLAKAKQVFRDQEATYATLLAAYETERADRIKHEGYGDRFYEFWQQGQRQIADLEDQLKRAGVPLRPNYHPIERGLTLDAVLQELRLLCHPDRWSQGQPASALAHEVMVYLHARDHKRADA